MITIESQITDVTVYRDRARIIREASIDLKAGIHHLVFEDLPDRLITSSVRISVSGQSAEILSVEAKRKYTTIKKEEYLEQIETAKADLTERQQQQIALEDNKKLLAKQKEDVERLSRSVFRNLGQALAKRETSLDNLAELKDYFSEQYQRFLQQERELENQTQEIAEEIERIENKIDSLKQSSNLRHLQISADVHLELLEATSITLYLSYDVKEAKWYPVYTLQVRPNSLQLLYMAVIRQQSGEAWPALNLAVSTTTLGQKPEIPQLRAWYIDQLDPEQSKAQTRTRFGNVAGQSIIGTTRRMVEEEIAKASGSEGLQVSTAQIDSDKYALEYRIEQPTAIPDDGSEINTAIAVLDMPAVLDYVCIPKVNEQVIRRAKVLNASNYVLLPGQLNIVQEGSSIGEVKLKMIAPNEEFELPLAVEERIKIFRQLVNQDIVRLEDEERRQHIYRYIIRISNYLNETISLTMRDQLPISAHPEVNISLQDATPEPVEVNGLNIIKWNLDFAANESKDITIQFIVECPATMRLSGI